MSEKSVSGKGRASDRRSEHGATSVRGGLWCVRRGGTGHGRVGDGGGGREVLGRETLAG